MNGIEAFIEILAQYNVRYVFGNPGTTELPLNDALARDDRLEYILALQEVPAMAIADGYAQASGTPGVVNVHICCGLGNAMGMLYNAFREGTPLIVTAGQQDQRMALEEPILWGQMVETARPWTKWAHEVRNSAEIPTVLRRAVQTALTPPCGPVFLSLPLDVQCELFAGETADLRRAPDLNIETTPPKEAVERATEVLASALSPGILVGSRVCEANAVAELVAVAERLGAPVMHEATTSHGRCSFPSDHPLAAPPLPFWSPEVRRRLEDFDVLLVVGMKLMQQYIRHEPSCPIPAGVRLIQIDENQWELNKNYPLEVGLLGHPRPALAALAKEIRARATSETQATVTARIVRYEKEKAKRIASLRKDAARFSANRPVAPITLMDQLSGILPSNVAVIEESPTTTMGGYFEQVGALKNTTGYFAQRGWALGWGLNCAIGVKMAWPERPVLALIGDGSAMYGIQGLWTAARYRIPVTFVICNNTEYKILKDCGKTLELESSHVERTVGLDIVDPAIDYTALARSLGVEAIQVTSAAEAADAVRFSFAENALSVIEVPIKRPA